jgi:hypothetical protein
MVDPAMWDTRGWKSIEGSADNLRLQAQIVCFIANQPMKSRLWQYEDLPGAPAGSTW